MESRGEPGQRSGATTHFGIWWCMPASAPAWACWRTRSGTLTSGPECSSQVRSGVNGMRTAGCTFSFHLMTSILDIRPCVPLRCLLPPGLGPCVLDDLAQFAPPSWELALDLVRWGRTCLDYCIRFPR